MIVPGSPFVGLDHPFSWYAIVKEKTTGKQWTYWFNGTQLNRETVATYVAQHYTGVDVVTIDRCTKMPDRALQPVPPSHFQLGVFKQMREFDQKKYGAPLLSRTTIRQRIGARAT